MALISTSRSSSAKDVTPTIDGALCDQAARDWGLSATRDLNELLDVGIDVVDLCTPPAGYEQQITQCLDVRVHAICEKQLVGLGCVAHCAGPVHRAVPSLRGRARAPTAAARCAGCDATAGHALTGGQRDR